METEGKFYFHFLAVPAEAFLNPVLKKTDIFLFSLIKNMSHSEEGCWASNKYFADILRVTERTISSGISALRKHRYITMEGGFGSEKRVLHVDNSYKDRYEWLVSLFNKAYVDNLEKSREEYKNL